MQSIFRRWLWPLLFAFGALGMIVWNLRPVQSLDIGWHLAAGRYMAQHHLPPRVDVFSSTCCGRPWIDSYWF